MVCQYDLHIMPVKDTGPVDSLCYPTTGIGGDSRINLPQRWEVRYTICNLLTFRYSRVDEKLLTQRSSISARYGEGAT